LKINRIMQFCNLFMGRPSYFTESIIIIIIIAFYNELTNSTTIEDMTWYNKRVHKINQ